MIVACDFEKEIKVELSCSGISVSGSVALYKFPLVYFLLVYLMCENMSVQWTVM